MVTTHHQVGRTRVLPVKQEKQSLRILRNCNWLTELSTTDQQWINVLSESRVTQANSGLLLRNLARNLETTVREIS